MSTLNGSINLMKFVGARKVIDKNNKKCILIPVDDNPTIISGEKGAYANIRVVEKESTYNDRHYTHFIALSLGKKKFDELKASGKSTEEINSYSPVLGNLETYTPQDNYKQESFKDAGGYDDLPEDF